MLRHWSENPRAVVDFISQFPCWKHWAIWLAQFAKPSLSGANFILVKRWVQLSLFYKEETGCVC